MLTDLHDLVEMIAGITGEMETVVIGEMEIVMIAEGMITENLVAKNNFKTAQHGGFFCKYLLWNRGVVN